LVNREGALAGVELGRSGLGERLGERRAGQGQRGGGRCCQLEGALRGDGSWRLGG
jgi:hypothetical protein